MSLELIELARRAVACKGWRWMPGMVTVPPFARRLSAAEIALSLHDENALPDLSDPATLGCLLALVRDAWSDQTIAARFEDERGWWVVDGNIRAECAHGDGEPEALVVALEAAS